ncbi:MAG: pilus assembly FimT family protein [Planctomycetota bacterium]
MTTTHRRTLGFTLIELLVVVAIIALLVSILLPSLGRAKDLAMTIVCSSRHQGAYKGWAYYGNQFGVWIAPWDTENMLNDDNYRYDQQWPYPMGIYATGESIPSGRDVYDPEDGWYNPWGTGGIGEIVHAKQLQCSVMEGRPDTNPWWKEETTMSYFVMGPTGRDTQGNWTYDLHGYPEPEKMTHPSTTGLIMCQAGDAGAEGTNAWVGYDGFFAIDPHMGESNVTFSDGHTETLGHTDLYETMWMSMWERGDQVDHDPLQ